MALKGVVEIVLLVQDVQRGLAFYRDTLGLRVISPPTLQGPVFLQVGEGEGVPNQIVLVPRPSDAPPLPADRRHRNVHHIGLEIAPSDFQAEWERLKGLGLEVRTGDHPFLPVQAIYIDDPDGNEIEIVARVTG